MQAPLGMAIYHKHSDTARTALLIYLTCCAPVLNLWPHYLLWSLLGKEGKPQKNVCYDQAEWKTAQRTLLKCQDVTTRSEQQSSSDLSLGGNILATRERAADNIIVSFFQSEEIPAFCLSNERMLFLCFFNVEIKSATGNTLKPTTELPIPNPTPSHIHVTSPWRNILL